MQERVNPPFAGRVGVVVIGRNEGDRLKACLASLSALSNIVYVDSGSTDGSQDHARSRGVHVVELAVPPAFTAARARNAGLAALLAAAPDLIMVQMVDGDCIVDGSWIAAGVSALDADPGLAGVFGRLHERFPERSIYNRLCDDEWDGPVGPVLSTGGVALFRVAAIREAGGYAEELVAGEEPDLCLRMRRLNWRLERLAAPMALHDAAMLHFRQWWIRTTRSGFAYATHVARHGRDAIPGWRGQVRRILLWAAVLPCLIVAGGLASLAYRPLAIGAGLLLLLYPAQVLRLGLRDRAHWHSFRLALISGFFNTLGKFAQLGGMLRFARDRLAGRAPRLIEYRAIP